VSLINIKNYLKKEIEYFQSEADSLEFDEETEICGDCKANSDSDESSALYAKN